jgi:Holliday junction resolvasome RuvABC endonuclease subunit
VDISAQLNATGHIAGRIDGIASAKGLRVIDMPATRWRGALCGRPNASDEDIKATLAVIVGRMPKKSNKHVRDACGVAFATIVQLVRERVTRLRES